MDAAPTPVAIRLRRSIPEHDAYTVRLADRRFTVLVTARPSDARRWVATTRWLHGPLLHGGLLVVGLGVQWTLTGRPLGGATPAPATLQLCVGHRCLVFHLAQAGGGVPEALRRFLADPRVTFVGSGSAHDRRMLWAHCGLHVARGRELRAMAGMGNASMEEMAHRFLGYPEIAKSRAVAMSAWHAPRLSMAQVQYAAVDAYLAFRLGVHLCPAGAAPAAHVHPPGPVPVRPAPTAHVRPPGPVLVRPAPPVKRALVLNATAPPAQRAPALVRPAPPVQRDPVAVRPRQPPPSARAPVLSRAAPRLECSPRAFCTVPRVECSPRAFCGVAVPAVGVHAANSKVADARAALTGSSDTDAETDYDGDTATRGLPVRAFASDSEDDDYSSDGFEHVTFGAFTDEEDQEDEEGNAVRTALGAPCVDDHEEDAYKEYMEMGILTADSNRDEGPEQFTADGLLTANVEEDDGRGYLFEYLGHSEAVLNDGEAALGQDDWNDQVDYGCDLNDDDGLEEFYLL